MTMTQTIPAEKSFNAVLFIGLGIVFWVLGVLFIRFAGSPLFDHSNPWLLPLFGVTIPLYWVFVKLLAIVGQVSGADLLRAFSLSSVAAAVLDGIALTWFPGLYGLEQAGLLLASAFLIYVFGAGLGIAYWVSR
jgi:hypothetical protein